MSKRKIVLFITLILLAAIQAGCSSASSYQKGLYDNNEAIADKADSYNYVSRVGSSINEESSIKFKTFNGMETLYEIKSEGSGKVIIDYTSEVEKGKFKCVLINPEDEVEVLFEDDSKGSIELDMKNGKSRIKVVGNDAGGEFSMTIKGEGDVSISKLD